MEYLELEITYNEKSEETNNILIAELSDIGFESFNETQNGLNAYIQKNIFNPEKIKDLYFFNKCNCNLNYKINVVENKNWNAVWESNFNPAFINNDCVIRAPFHNIKPKPKYEIIIMPKMSFGTGHHETTSLMIENILNLKISNKTVLDMGCGTGVLSILASKLNASKITSIDNDEWAFENSKENFKLNNINNADVFLGDCSLISSKLYDIILANINKNVLLSDIKLYSKSLSQKGILVLSGIYKTDFYDINTEATKNNLKFSSIIEKNKWVSIVYIKE